MQMPTQSINVSRKLTLLQQQWLTHIQQAEARQQSVTEYARENGLDADAMHRKRLTPYTYPAASQAP